ncbi:MAG: crossover junction endodeoxyribonuclease RuvC [Candidatus Sungiibacteriota bacterium]
MIILGIDPGTTAIGFAVLESGRPPRLLDAGLIPITKTNAAERLAELHHGLSRLIEGAKPSAAAVEKLFFSKNTKTAMAVAEARGAILLTAALARVSVYEYAPAEIKKVVTGNGAADKKAIQKMVMLTLPETANMRARDDVFDAIAAALTCHFMEFNKLMTDKGRCY